MNIIELEEACSLATYWLSNEVELTIHYLQNDSKTIRLRQLSVDYCNNS